MAIPALLGAAAKGLATGMAKDKAKNFITGKKKTVKPDAIKKKGGPEMGPEQEGALVVRPSSSLVESSTTSALAPIRPSPVPITETGIANIIINVGLKLLKKSINIHIARIPPIMMFC